MQSSTDDFAVELRTSFQLAMRRLASTITIVTTACGGTRSGMTATAVTSVSANPPALLVCINRSASLHPALCINAPFCINLLADGHGNLSHAFGGKLQPEERFSVGNWARLDDGTPYLVDAQASIFCSVDAMFDYATHGIFIGKVTRILLYGEVRPLIWGDGRFISSSAPLHR